MTDDQIERLRAAGSVWKHDFLWRSHARRPDVRVAAEHDPECEFCALLDSLAADLAAKTEALEVDPEKWSFSTLVRIAHSLLAAEYPPDVFTGASGDPGPVFVAKLRDALGALQRHDVAASRSPDGGEQ